MGIQDENMESQEDEDIKRDKPDLDVEQDDGDEDDLEQERTEERTIVKVKRDPDRREGESRSQYRSRKAQERAEEQEQLRAQVSSIAKELSELRLLAASRGAEPRQIAAPPPVEKKSGSRFGEGYQRLRRQQDLILANIRSSEDPKQIEELTAEFNSIEEEKRELEIKALMPKDQEPRRSNVDLAQEYWIRTLESEYADVYRNPEAVKYAKSLAMADNAKRNLRGLPLRTLEDDRATLAQVAEELGIRKPKAAKPTESARKLGGVGATPSRGGGTEYELTAEQMSLAEDMFPNDPDAPRKWVKKMRARGVLK